MNQQIIQRVYNEYISRNTLATPHEKKTWKEINYEITKRIIDLFVAGTGLILAIPILVLAMLAIKLESQGPVFYRQIRVGKDGLLFEIIKLRTMVPDAEKDGPQWAAKNDNRVTRVGRILRKTRIDEIPQLWNVLKGEMSMVGPRPERPNFTVQFNGEVPGFVERLQVKPGITGLAQVMGGYDLTPAEKLSLDREYIDRQGIWLDIKMIAKTVMVVLTGYGAR